MLGRNYFESIAIGKQFHYEIAGQIDGEADTEFRFGRFDDFLRFV
jgi:hypothetical protein